MIKIFKKKREKGDEFLPKEKRKQEKAEANKSRGKFSRGIADFLRGGKKQKYRIRYVTHFRMWKSTCDKCGEVYVKMIKDARRNCPKCMKKFDKEKGI